MQNPDLRIVVIGTGGTISGRSDQRGDNVGYRAGQLGVDELLKTLPGLPALAVETEQHAQVDSKDVDLALWRSLAQRAAGHLARPDVAGIVITHGTDTLEETAYFLHRVLAPDKPVVLTAAMRPATALLSDGPQNLLDALAVAAAPGARGVVAVVANTVFGAVGLRKVHSYRIDAFGAGDAGPIGRVEEGQLKRWRPWPGGDAIGLAAIERDPSAWPRVEIVVSHAGARGDLVDALVAQPSPQRVAGIVVAGTGNGTVHHALEAALHRAMAAGVAVRRCTRCAAGGVIGGDPADLPSGGDLTPVQARIELMLELLAWPDG